MNEQQNRIAEENFVTGFKTGVALTTGCYLIKKAYDRGLIKIDWKKIRNN